MKCIKETEMSPAKVQKLSVTNKCLV